MGHRIGLGSDLHRLVKGDGLPLGGVFIPCSYSCQAVSDGDVLLHALVDALLGACGEGDIGEHHKEDQVARGQNSALFVAETIQLLGTLKAEIVNIDCIINLEKPKLSEWKEKIRGNLATLLALPASRINVKAKTGEGIGPIGESMAVSAEVVVLLEVDE